MLSLIDQEEPRPKLLLRALATLLRGGVRAEELGPLMARADPIELARLFYMIEWFDGRGLLCKSVEDRRGFHVAMVEPVGARRLPEAPLTDDTMLALSPYALAARCGETMVLEAATGTARILLVEPKCLWLFGLLAAPTSAADVIAKADTALGRAAVMALLGSAVGAGIVELLDAQTGNSPAANASDQGWVLHDLLFHARSREGWNTAPCGATYRFRGQTAPSPALKQLSSERAVALPASALVAGSESFLAVLERRRSLREGEGPMTLQALGDLLYHAARVRNISVGPDGGEITDRPYPSAGASYELEIHVVVGRCAGLDPGIYTHDPANHRLVFPTGTANGAQFLEDARIACGATAVPDVLLVITSRFRRLAWKYESIAYALALKNAGVLLQTLCLTAAALDLAACPVGNGDGPAFCAATGLDYFEESPVAELSLYGFRSVKA
ncbi:SagB family peptide dehydrogenase [Rhizobacter sp. AJA081-3]|uniref:SagB family peptide dehydrogenase n=1 Tax=Rhizobacter sp. AJA081-3 TaxID=2753607 RepID=UPI001AE02D51|nr:SagB family peptide dehydrogenase [Rhizobacter sp. AJA081-3]QTN25679.1 SagB family peptide dehydrogenase [Rhizobacter sp. AJA081-3]